MRDDLVKRHVEQLRLTGGDLGDLCQPLADAIEALTAERDRLETALVYAKDYLDLGMEKMAFNVIRHALKGETP